MLFCTHNLGLNLCLSSFKANSKNALYKFILYKHLVLTFSFVYMVCVI